MNLSEIRTRVARVSGMSTSTAADLALIDAWANDAVIQFLKDTKVNVLQASLSLTAGTPDYTLDTDILAFTDVWLDHSQYDRIMEPTDSRQIMKMRLQGSVAGVPPQYYALQGANLIMLHPAPSANTDKLNIIYVPRPTSTLSASSDTPSATAYGNIPSEYHSVLEAYVKWKACEAEEHRASENGQMFMAEYNTGIARVRRDLNLKAGAFKAPARYGRNIRFPTNPGVDLRV
jgi:hypothetical protein